MFVTVISPLTPGSHYLVSGPFNIYHAKQRGWGSVTLLSVELTSESEGNLEVGLCCFKVGLTPGQRLKCADMMAHSTSTIYYCKFPLEIHTHTHTAFSNKHF